MVGAGTTNRGRGLVVTERDHHKIRVAEPGDPLGQRRHGVLDGLAVQRLDGGCVLPGDTGRQALSGHRIEDRAVADRFHGTIRGRGVHGVCDETKSISAITGMWPG